MVTFELVVRVCLLAVKAYRFMKGKHNRKTSAFVKACLAYMHITVPSLDGAFLKLRLYLQCGQVALVNNMVSQGEAFLKSAVQLIPEVPESIQHTTNGRTTKIDTEPEMLPYTLNLASFLLVFPGHPKNGPFHLVKGLLNAVQKYPPWQNACVGKCKLYLGLVRLFSTFAQRKFPYHVNRVDSNDTLFGSNEIYIKSLTHFTNTLITQTLNQLHGIVEGKDKDKTAKASQSELALDLVNILTSTMTMNKQSATLVVKLYRLAAGVKETDKYRERTLSHIESKRGTWYQDIVARLKVNG